MAAIVVREARPDDYNQLHQLITQILAETKAQKSADFSSELWRWQYLSPDIKSLIVIAEDNQSFAGSFHLVKQEMSVFGRPRRMALMQDLGVLPEYRRRGVFMLMSEFARARLQEIGWDVTFAFLTVESSFAGFVKKQGYRHIANIPVMLRPLDWRQLLSARLPLRLPWRVIGKVANSLYDIVTPLPAVEADVTIEPIETFSSEVDELAQQFLDVVGIGCIRESRFLNWRFIAKPTHDYTAWGIRRGGMLCAYLVTRRVQLFGVDALLLMDIGCFSGQEKALRTLIAHRMVHEREEGAVLAITAGMHPFFRRLRRLGFVTVPNRLNPRPMRFVIQAHTNRVGNEVCEPANWFTTLGDWDVF